MGASDRMIQYLEFKGITKYKFYKLTGFSNKFLDNSSNMGTDKAEIILRHYPDINPEWLLTGQGPMLRNGSILHQEEDITPIAKPSRKQGEGIPLIPFEAAAGAFRGELAAVDVECDYYIVPVFSGADFLIPVKGSSMAPKYSSGDIIACKKLTLNDIFFQWNKIYVLDTDQGPLVKRVRQGTSEKTIQLISDNPEYEPFELQIIKLYAIAIVLGVIRLE